jgi:hypothetical protein
LPSFDARIRAGIGLASPTWDEEHGHECERRVARHEKKESAITVKEIEEASVQRVANRAAKRHAEQEQRCEDASMLARDGLDEEWMELTVGKVQAADASASSGTT